MKKIKLFAISTIGAIVGFGATTQSQAQTPITNYEYFATVTLSAHTSLGTNCTAGYLGQVQWTNTSGSVWITNPPGGYGHCTMTDVSGYPAPYASVVEVAAINGKSWCGDTTVTFPCTNTLRYVQSIFIMQSNPTNATTMGPIVFQQIWSH